MAEKFVYELKKNEVIICDVNFFDDSKTKERLVCLKYPGWNKLMNLVMPLTKLQELVLNVGKTETEIKSTLIAKKLCTTTILTLV